MNAAKVQTRDYYITVVQLSLIKLILKKLRRGYSLSCKENLAPSEICLVKKITLIISNQLSEKNQEKETLIIVMLGGKFIKFVFKKSEFIFVIVDNLGKADFKNIIEN